MSARDWFNSRWHKGQPTLDNVVDGSAAPEKEGESDKERLARLWVEAQKTDLWQNFAKKVSSKVEVVLGTVPGGFEACADIWSKPPRIIVNKLMFASEADLLWVQILVFEMGNHSRKKDFALIEADAAGGELGRDMYICRNEYVEYENREAIISAFQQGQFCTPGSSGCEPANPSGSVSFPTYYNHPKVQPHKEFYGGQWDGRYKRKYKKKHGNTGGTVVAGGDPPCLSGN